MPVLTTNSIQATIDKANGTLNRVNALLAQTLTPEVEDALTDLAQHLNELIAELTDICNEMVAVLSAAVTSPLPWVRNDRILPRHDDCFEPFLDEVNNILHPAQLIGWDLATYIRCVVQLNFNEWISGAPYTDGVWNGLMMRYLPDINTSSTILSIDPFDPLVLPLMQNYDTLPDCSYDANGNVTNAPCKTGDLIANIWLPSTGSGDNLPYLPSTIITRPDEGRGALAQATWNLWSGIGILQDRKELSAWVNAYEHSVFSGNNTTDQDARQRLMEFIHCTYFTRAQGDPITFLKTWSVTLFQQRTTSSGLLVDDRTYGFLDRVLTSPASLYNGRYIFDDGLDWANGTMSGYSSETLAQISASAFFTFGSTEVDNFSQTDQILFRDSARQGVLWYEFIPNSDPSGDQGVYFMTQSQFNCAQAVARHEQTVHGCIDELS